MTLCLRRQSDITRLTGAQNRYVLPYIAMRFHLAVTLSDSKRSLVQDTLKDCRKLESQKTAVMEPCVSPEEEGAILRGLCH